MRLTYGQLCGDLKRGQAVVVVFGQMGSKVGSGSGKLCEKERQGLDEDARLGGAWSRSETHCKSDQLVFPGWSIQ